jgi:hypothetical protein
MARKYTIELQALFGGYRQLEEACNLLEPIFVDNMLERFREPPSNHARTTQHNAESVLQSLGLTRGIKKSKTSSMGIDDVEVTIQQEGQLDSSDERDKMRFEMMAAKKILNDADDHDLGESVVGCGASLQGHMVAERDTPVNVSHDDVADKNLSFIARGQKNDGDCKRKSIDSDQKKKKKHKKKRKKDVFDEIFGDA